MNMLISDKLVVYVAAVQGAVMTCCVSVDLSAIMMSSCIQLCGISTGCDLMFTVTHIHSFCKLPVSVSCPIFCPVP